MKKSKLQSKPKQPAPEENRTINAGIAADPDTWELSPEDFEKMRPTSEVHPEIVEAYRRSRGKQKAPTKVATSIRLSVIVLEAYKKSGAGWQSRIDQDLQDIVSSRQLRKSPRRRGTE